MSLQYDQNKIEKLLHEIHVEVFDKTQEKLDSYQMAILRFNLINNERLINSVNHFENKMDEMHKIVTQKNFKTIYFEGKKTAFWYALGKYGIGGLAISIGLIMLALSYFYAHKSKEILFPSSFVEQENHYEISKNQVKIEKNKIIIFKTIKPSIKN